MGARVPQSLPCNIVARGIAAQVLTSYVGCRPHNIVSKPAGEFNVKFNVGWVTISDGRIEADMVAGVLHVLGLIPEWTTQALDLPRLVAGTRVSAADLIYVLCRQGVLQHVKQIAAGSANTHL
jgi:hypothetical protein